MSKYTRILSIDGGGIRGIIPAMVLAELERILQKATGNENTRLADHFDLVAGTSTGGILACGMLIPNGATHPRPKFTASELADIYLEWGDDIFSRSVFRKIRSLGGMAEEKYSNEGLLELLDDYMGNCTLKDLLQRTLITAYDIKRRKAHYFCKHKADNANDNYYVRDVAWATSAAPTYFEPARIKSMSGISYPLIDGGIFANNPALCAYAEARASFEHHPKASEMVILSLGTGRGKKDRYSYKDAKDWGKAEWLKPALDIMRSGVAETVTYQLQQIYLAVGARNQFMRIEPALGDASAHLDNASNKNLRRLRDAGQKSASENATDLKDFASLLLA